MPSHGGLKRHCPRNQLINSGNSRTLKLRVECFPCCSTCANPYTNAQKPLCEEHVPCFLGTKYLRKAANFIGFVNAARIGLVAAQNPEARVRHAESERRHANARSAWDASSQPAWLTREIFSQRIRPLLASISTSAIRSRIRVSRWYASRIRQGYCPHPRHWRAQAKLVKVSPDLRSQSRQSN